MNPTVLIIFGVLFVTTVLVFGILAYLAASDDGGETLTMTTTTGPKKKKPKKVDLNDNDDAGDESVADSIVDPKGTPPKETGTSNKCPPYASQGKYTGETASRRTSSGQYVMRGDNLAKDFICKSENFKIYPIGNIKSNLGPLRTIDVTQRFTDIKTRISRDWDDMTIDDFNQFDVPIPGLCGPNDIDPLDNPIVTCKLNADECTVRTPFEVASWNVHRTRGRTTQETTGYSEFFYPMDMCIKSTEDESKRRLYFWRCTRSANKLLEVLLGMRGKSAGSLKVLDIDVYIARNIDRSWNHMIAELDPGSSAAGIAGGAYVRIKYAMDDPLPVICHELAHIGAGGHGAPLFEYTQYKLQLLAHELQNADLLGTGYFVRISGGDVQIDMTAMPGPSPERDAVVCGYRGIDGKGYFCW